MARKHLSIEQIEKLFTQNVKSRGFHMSMKTKGIDRGYEKSRQSIKAAIKAAPFVKIGIQSNAGKYDNKTSIAEVAAYNEFGTNKIPSRPFMRQTMAKGQRKFNNTTDKLIAAIQQGKMDVIVALNLIGSVIARSMERNLTIGPWTPNAEKTVLRKKSSRPLIDTRKLRGSITWRVDES